MPHSWRRSPLTWRRCRARSRKRKQSFFAKEEELIQAKVEENDQYEDMKKRIKYMYENGNVQFIEILLESQTIADFLNKAEYINTISEYDRDMLDEFQAVVKKVEKQEAEIRDEYEDGRDAGCSDRQAGRSIYSGCGKEAEISELGSQLDETNAKLSELQAAAEAAQRKQAEATSGYRPSNAGAAVVTGNGTFTHHARDTLISPVISDTGNSRWQEQVPTIKVWTLRLRREHQSMRRPEVLWYLRHTAEMREI